MFKVDVDFAWEEKIQDVLKAIRKHRGKIVDFDPEGPGGGNPNILLGFDAQKVRREPSPIALLESIGERPEIPAKGRVARAVRVPKSPT